MAHLVALSKEQSKIMFKQNSISPATDEEDIDKKRRQLLIISAKRPFKRSRLVQVQQQYRREGKGETDTISTASLSLSSSSTATKKSPISKKSKGNHIRRLKRENQRMVSFDTKCNKTSIVPSHRDLDESERRSYYFQRDDYVRIKRNIQRTIEFLKSPTDSTSSSGSSIISSPQFEMYDIDEHCVRGLECLAEDAVNDFKKRIQKTSKSSVFRFQENLKRRISDNRVPIHSAHEMWLNLPEVYKKCSSQCEHIARRWGHYDAIDAGYDPTSSSAMAVSCATAISPPNDESGIVGNTTVETREDNNGSLSSLSYDGDDGEDNNESSDGFNLPPVVNAGESANEFDSLPERLFNF